MRPIVILIHLWEEKLLIKQVKLRDTASHKSQEVNLISFPPMRTLFSFNLV